jgi:hypothetical protein
MFKTNQLKETMKQCKICDDKPTEIFKGFLVYMGVNICKSCMIKNGDSHHDKIGTYPNNYIATDYFYLKNNNQ